MLFDRIANFLQFNIFCLFPFHLYFNVFENKSIDMNGQYSKNMICQIPNLEV